MSSQTILIVDDHAGFRACARHLLEREGFLVVGEAADGASAVECAHDLTPGVALVDVHLPDIDGFEVALRLAKLEVPPIVVLTSSHARCEVEALAVGSGARGFLPKDELSREAIEELLA